MPTINIKRTPPVAEGEYVGKLEKVASSFTKNGDPRFTYNIRMKDGTVIKDSLYFGEKVLWRVDNIGKSANLVPPENGAAFSLTPDDLEGRTVYFGVKHNPGENGKIYVNINFHAMSYAIQQNPDLAGVYPPQAPRKLREAPPEDPQGESEPPASATPPVSPVPPPPVRPAGADVGMAEAEDDDLSPEEYAQALEQAKRNKAARTGKAEA
jgi:hypothetical protein